MRKTKFRTDVIKLASTLSLGLLLAACGGGDGSRVDDITNNSSNSNSSSNQGPSARHLGYGAGSNFVAGQIDIGIGANETLSPGGTTSLTVNFVDQDNSLSTDSIQVTFNSRCIAANEASLSESDVTTTSGEVTVTYTANGCVGTDEITATTSFSGTLLTASGSLNVEADTVSSIEFIDVSPSLVSLKGTGGTESSRARFLVRGSTGAPVKEACVEFSLNTTAGGVNLVNSTCSSSDPSNSKRAKTNAEGHASIFVQAGTVATAVTITAKHLESGLSTQSRGLRVSTGVPDQKSMTLSASVQNPHAWEIDGTEVIFTIRLADAFNNPPADGTTVSFTTSGGAIVGSCVTTGGECNVAWRSQNPKPADGRVRILAHTIGNESYTDANANGWYDPDDENESDLFEDLAEAYLDANHDNTYNAGELFIDFNQNGVRDQGDGLYNGVLCRAEDQAALKCTRDGVTIRRDYMIVMSSNQPYLEGGRLPGQLPSEHVGAGETLPVSVTLADRNGNALPFGTTVSIDSTQADNLNIAPASYTIPSTTSPRDYNFSLRNTSDDESADGNIVFVITTPDGLITRTAATNLN